MVGFSNKKVVNVWVTFLWLNSIRPGTPPYYSHHCTGNLTVPVFGETVSVSWSCSYEIFYEYQQYIHSEFALHFDKNQTGMGDFEWHDLVCELDFYQQPTLFPDSSPY